MHSCRKVQRDYLSLVVFHMVRAGSYWYKADGIYACAFSEKPARKLFRPVQFNLRYVFWFISFLLFSLFLSFFFAVVASKANI